MNPLSPSNPLTNCRIIGANANPETYHRQDVKRGDPAFVMSRGSLADVLANPRKWVQSDGIERKSSAMDWGKLIDCLALTPSEFENRYAICPAEYPDKKTGELKPWNWNANFCKDWREQNKDRESVTASTLLAAEYAVERLNSDPIAGEFIRCSQPQVYVMGEYHDEATGITVPVKGLIDLLPGEPFACMIGDLKTGDSVNPRMWNRTVHSYALDMQAALYLDLHTAATNEDRNTFCHIAQESEPPYEVACHMLSQEFVELGRRKYIEALKIYCACLSTGQWAGYSHREQIDGWNLIQPEPWMME